MMFVEGDRMKNYYGVVKKRLIVSLTLVFGLLFAVTTAIAWKLNKNLGVGIGIAVATGVIQYLLGPYIVELLYKTEYGTYNEYLSEEVLSFIDETCKNSRIKRPNIGIINDGNPNAFTFGHLPGNARLVLTRGLIDVLSEEELKSVIAHEIGHIKHYDFIVMMIISIIPLILYQVYAWTRNRDKSKPSYWIGIGAYCAYILSQYFVLSFSRIREYYADSFSKQIMKDGRALKSALIKIAYGFTNIEKSESNRISSMAFTNNVQNEAYMLTRYKRDTKEKTEDILMGWDMKSVWGKWYELNSTHPLTGKRILALGEDGEEVNSSKTSLGDISVFLFEAIISLLPYISLVLIIYINRYNSIFDIDIIDSIKNCIKHHPGSLSLLGISILIKYYYSYGGKHEKYSIDELLSREDASPVKGIAATLEGKVIGKGIPGFFCSEDVILDDETAIIYTDYRQPIKMLEFLFGILKVDEILDKDVKVVGWYKRGMRPYFACKYIAVDGKKYKSYNYILTQLFGYGLLIAGIVLPLVMLI